MTTCPTCNQPTDTKAMAFLHERVHKECRGMQTENIILYPKDWPWLAELMEAYAAQAVAAERERVAGVLSRWAADRVGSAVNAQSAAKCIAQRLGLTLEPTKQ